MEFQNLISLFHYNFVFCFVLVFSISKELITKKKERKRRKCYILKVNTLQPITAAQLLNVAYFTDS